MLNSALLLLRFLLQLCHIFLEFVFVHLSINLHVLPLALMPQG